MRLANDLIIIPVGTQGLYLRPTLRAAIRLHARFGLLAVANDIADGKIGTICDVIAEGTDPDSARRIIGAVKVQGVAKLNELAEPLMLFLMALLGHDGRASTGAAPETTTTADKPTHDMIGAFLDDLFASATGWLGWSPAEAMAATPNEIIIGRDAHIAKLRAIHGAAETDADTSTDALPPREPSPAEVQAGIAKLKAIAARRKQ